MAEDNGSILLTVFLKHQKDKNLDQIRERLVDREFWKRFPPGGCEVVSWYVMMGIGQVATLRVPTGQVARRQHGHRGVPLEQPASYRMQISCSSSIARFSLHIGNAAHAIRTHVGNSPCKGAVMPIYCAQHTESPCGRATLPVENLLIETLSFRLQPQVNS